MDAGDGHRGDGPGPERVSEWSGICCLARTGAQTELHRWQGAAVLGRVGRGVEPHRLERLDGTDRVRRLDPQSHDHFVGPELPNEVGMIVREYGVFAYPCRLGVAKIVRHKKGHINRVILLRE